MSSYGSRSQLASVMYRGREIRYRVNTLTVGGGRRTFELSAPKVRTGEDECSGKCGIQVGMFLGRLSNATVVRGTTHHAPRSYSPNITSRRFTGLAEKLASSIRTEPSRRPCIPSPLLVRTRRVPSSTSSRPSP